MTLQAALRPCFYMLHDDDGYNSGRDPSFGYVYSYNIHHAHCQVKRAYAMNYETAVYWKDTNPSTDIVFSTEKQLYDIVPHEVESPRANNSLAEENASENQPTTSKTSPAKKQDDVGVSLDKGYDVVLDAYEELLNDGVGDVELEAEGQRLRCMKGVLAGRSKYFEDVFDKDEDVEIVPIEGVSFEILKRIVKYIYTARYDFEPMVEELLSQEVQGIWDTPKPKLGMKYKLLYCQTRMTLEVVNAAHTMQVDELLQLAVFDLIDNVYFRHSMFDKLTDLSEKALILLLESAEKVKDMCCQHRFYTKKQTVLDFCFDLVRILPDVKKINSSFVEELKESYVKTRQRSIYFGKDAELVSFLGHDYIAEYDDPLAEIDKLVQEGADVVESHAAHHAITLLGTVGQESHYLDKIWEILEYFFDKGYDVNCQDSRGMTLLHHTVSCGCFEHSIKLIQKHADPRIRDNMGKSCYERQLEDLDKKICRMIHEIGVTMPFVVSDDNEHSIVNIASREVLQAYFKIHSNVLEAMRLAALTFRDSSDVKICKEVKEVEVNKEFLDSFVNSASYLCQAKKEDFRNFLKLAVHWKEVPYDEKRDLHCAAGKLLLPELMMELDSIQDEFTFDDEEVEEEELKQLLYGPLKASLMRWEQPDRCPYLVSMRTIGRYLVSKGKMDSLPQDSWIRQIELNDHFENDF